MFKGHKVIVIGDAHDSPHIKQDRFKWIGKYIKAAKPDYIIQIGDWASFDSLSFFQKNSTQAGKLKDAYMVDIDSLRSSIDLLDKHIDNSRIPRHVTFGNHEQRVYRFEENIPEISGMMKKELHDTYTKRNWKFSPYGAFKIIGGVSFTHCPLNIMGKEYGGKNCEVQVANDATNDIVFGHTHKFRDWKQAKIGDKNSVRIINVGCALPFGHIEEYAKLNMTGWSWGIVELGIWDNHIQESQFISMDRLEKQYG
jgi:predicted phosphodiesterase